MKLRWQCKCGGWNYNHWEGCFNCCAPRPAEPEPVKKTSITGNAPSPASQGKKAPQTSTGNDDDAYNGDCG